MRTMAKFLKIGLIGLIGISLMENPLAFAKKGGGGAEGMPSGFAQGEKKRWEDGNTPPGWDEGEKKGWGDEDMPPGLAKRQPEE